MSQVKEVQSEMLRRFKPYPAYKDSGFEWLGEIPETWEVRRLKTIADVRVSNVDKKSVEGDEPVRLCNYVDVYYNDHIGPDLDFMPATATRGQVSRFSLRAGDVLVTKDSESWTDIAVPAVVDEDLSNVLCGYHLALLRPNAGVDGAFLARAFSAVGPRDQFQLAANGITRFGLGNDALTTSVFGVPSLEDQRAISAFLDRETIRIDELIAKKERLIELLEEKRISVITRAVTKGLDPNVTMNDSGVEWLGEIPAHWELVAARRLIDGIEQGWSPVADDRPVGVDEWGVIKLSAVAQGSFRADEHKTLPFGIAPETRYEIRDGDFLLTRSNTPSLVGDVCVVRSPPPRLMLCDLVYRLTLDSARVDPTFLAYWFISPAGRQQISIEARGASQSMVKVSQALIRSWLVPVPPRSEQERIVRWIDRMTNGIDALIAKVREAITKLQELRAALISAAVTGKIDVREST